MSTQCQILAKTITLHPIIQRPLVFAEEDIIILTTGMKSTVTKYKEQLTVINKIQNKVYILTIKMAF